MKSDTKTFDEILEIVGNNGPFQTKFNLIFNFVMVLFAAMPYFNLVIAMSIPEHWCHVPGQEATNFTMKEWKIRHIPKEVDTKGRETFSKCKIFNVTQNFNHPVEESPHIVDCQHGWEYDKTWYTTTAASQEDWVCEKGLYVTNTFAFCRIGELIGSFLAGQLGDTLGRKPTFYISLITLLIGKFSSAFTASVFPLFLLAAVVGSLTSTVVFLSPLIIGMEISRDEDRAKLAMMQSLGWTTGLAVMPFAMWLLRDWTHFMIATTLPCMAFLFLNRYIVESPRWLLNKGKISKCVQELKKIAKANKTRIPDDIILSLNAAAKQQEKLYGVMSLFSHWRIAKNTTCIILCWVVTALCYFVLILNNNNLGGNPYLNFFYQGLAEFPAYIIGKYCCDYFGRRWTHITAFVVTSLGCLPLIIFINDPNLTWLDSIIAVFLKFSVSFAFYAVNLHSLEIYPTCLRQTGMALGAVSANAFGILGPYVVYLGTSADARYPYIILALLALFAASCGFLLPETLHHKLPETLKETQEFGKEQQFFSFPRRRAGFEPVRVIKA